MTVVVDIGNTNICVAVFTEEDVLSFEKSYPDSQFHTASEFSDELKKICPSPEKAATHIAPSGPSLGVPLGYIGFIIFL